MRAADIESLLSHVQDYQRESVLRSIKEHNLLAASKIYRNISIEELARLLQIEPLEAEQVAAGMMKEGRLKGSIDQQENLLTFEDARAEVSMWCAAPASPAWLRSAKHRSAFDSPAALRFRVRLSRCAVAASLAP